MQLICSNEKNIKKLLFTKTWIENQKQISKKNETIDKKNKKIRLIKKQTKKYICKRCKYSIKFDNNIKLYEYIRIRHAKKSKTIVSFFAQISKSKFISQQLIFSSFLSFESIIFSFFSSKLLFFSMFALKIVRKFSKNVLFFSSIATSKKLIFWTKIVSRFIVAFKFFRFSIATFKSMCKSLKNVNIVCLFISFRIFTSKFYFIVNNLFRMFVKKSNSFDLQSN